MLVGALATLVGVAVGITRVTCGIPVGMRVTLVGITVGTLGAVGGRIAAFQYETNKSRSKNRLLFVYL